MARKSKNSFTVAGKVWATGGEVAEHYAVKPNVFHMRINRLGWSVEEALGIKEREPKSRAPIEFKGKNIILANISQKNLGWYIRPLRNADGMAGHWMNV